MKEEDINKELNIEYKLSTNRYTIIKYLKNHNNNIGIELGVAEGNYSARMLESNKFKFFYGVDSYENFPHDEKQFNKTKKKLSKYSNYKLIRDTFENSLSLFDDNYFDYIYIDGFAGTGNNNGQTLNHWFSKLKIGGIIAGDDYHSDWPIIIKTVNSFIEITNLKLNITAVDDDNVYSQYPSWFVIKKNNNINLPQKKDEQIGKQLHVNINRRKYFLKYYKSRLYYLLKALLGNKIFYSLLRFYHLLTK